MKKSWATVKIGDICNINKNSYSKNDNYYFVNYLDTGNLTENTISEIQKIDLYIEELPSRAKRKVTDKSILYSTVRPNQKHFGIVKNIPENFLVSTGFAVIDAIESKADPYFLYYYLSRDEITTKLHAIAEQSTSAYPAIKPTDIMDLEIPLPPLPTQQKIAAVLSALDDKIELNRQINANLEQQAQAIFKNWFVDFEPFGGEMPRGWRVGKLSEILAEIETGKRENGGALSCGIPSIGAEKIENITYYDFSTEKYISQDFYQKMTKGKIKSGDVLLYKDGAYTGKSTMFLNDFPYKECAVNEHVFLLRTAESKYQCFLYLLISQKDTKTYLHTMASSKAAQPGLNKTELQSLDIIIPTNDVLDKFEEIIRPLFTLIIHGLEQSRTLASIRDTLLPKLMSGEIDVSSVKV